MGIQSKYTIDVSSANNVGGLNRTADTINYITDLLGELSSIASVSGLNELSDDMQGIVSKHTIGSA